MASSCLLIALQEIEIVLKHFKNNKTVYFIWPGIYSNKFNIISGHGEDHRLLSIATSSRKGPVMTQKMKTIWTPPLILCILHMVKTAGFHLETANSPSDYKTCNIHTYFYEITYINTYIYGVFVYKGKTTLHVVFNFCVSFAFVLKFAAIINV